MQWIKYFLQNFSKIWNIFETNFFIFLLQITSLKADVYNIEKKHRERVQQLIKEKEESIRAIELARSSKSSKKNW